MTAAALSLALLLISPDEPQAIAALEQHCAEAGQPSQVLLAQGWIDGDALTGYDEAKGCFYAD